ncbi:MAG: lactate utilization protein [Rhodospirillales bacterium]|nr:lactate utilization protein [Rhodospirillales bacterium]
MSAARDDILARVRAALERPPVPGRDAAGVERRLRACAPNVVPARGGGDHDGQVATFIAEAERADATVDRVASRAHVANAVARYLAGNNLPTEIRRAPGPDLDGIDWAEAPSLSVTAGPARAPDPVAVTSAVAGIAETGTLVLLAGPDSPTTLNFLPDTHIVVMEASRITGSYEDMWKIFRANAGAAGMPRVVNWITGPSRTADIEQTLLLGAHGPRRLHVVLIDGEKT